jgi:hypothetical protein
MAGGKPGGGSGGRMTSNTGTQYQPGQDFWSFNPRDIAGFNPMMRQVAGSMGNLPFVGAGNMGRAQDMLGRLASGGSGYLDRANQVAGQSTPWAKEFGEAQNYGSQLRDISRRQVTGANLAKDPALKAAEVRFEAARMPMIQNMAAQAGLGRSNTMVNAASLAKSNEMLPMIQDALGREERGIGREMGATSEQMANAMQRGGARMQAGMSDREQQIRTLMGSAGQEFANLGNAASGYAGLGGQEYGQAANALNMGWGMGQDIRGVEQEQRDAPYNEQMRLYNEALNAMYGPLGMLGSVLGGRGTSTTSKK